MNDTRDSLNHDTDAELERELAALDALDDDDEPDDLEDDDDFDGAFEDLDDDPEGDDENLAHAGALSAPMAREQRLATVAGSHVAFVEALVMTSMPCFL